MKTATKVIALVAILAVPAFADGDQNEKDTKPGMCKFDTNGDGKVCKKEFKAAMQACIKKHDADGDGKLSKEEKKAAKQAGDLPSKPKHGGKKTKNDKQ